VGFDVDYMFCDASAHAYATAVFLRAENTEGYGPASASEVSGGATEQAYPPSVGTPCRLYWGSSGPVCYRSVEVRPSSRFSMVGFYNHVGFDFVR